MSAAPSPAVEPVGTQRPLLAGVCAVLGRRLSLDPVLLRLAFVALAASGTGLLLYAVAAIALAVAGEPLRPLAIRGLAGRQGAGAAAGARGLSQESWRVAAGVGVLMLAALVGAQRAGVWFLPTAIVWPLVLTASGLALIWRQATDAPLGAGAQRLVDLRGAGALRAVLGAVLVIGGALAFLTANDALGSARNLLLSMLVVGVGLTLIFGPWWLRLTNAFTAERAERIRSQERAEMAAHLHDSVLQTLALIQRRAADPREVATLARRQERELRSWLSGRAATPAAPTLAAALEQVAAEIEEVQRVAVDAITVGDCPLDERTVAVVAAAREALANGARFAGTGQVSLYAEVDDARVSVFVRDRGSGFDPDSVPADRRGVRESIIGRMERHGGSATVRSAPGEGCEVELTLPREEAA